MSKDPFIEVFFEAEVSRFEYPDFEEIAQRNCKEDLNSRQKSIQELRSMIIDRGQCSPRRMDDTYLLMFLRCRRYIVPLAHKLMIRYEDLHRRYRDTVYNFNILNADRVLRGQLVYAGTMPESPRSGRTMIIRNGRWNPKTVTLEDILRVGIGMSEIVLQQPRIQVLGVSIIVDLEGYGIGQLKYLTPSILHQAVSLMGVNMPVTVHGVHIINYNWLISSIFYLLKPFIPSESYKYIHFHGQDMTSLHKHIEPASLPEEYGGHCSHVMTFQEWLSGVRKYIYRDDVLMQELRDIGYSVEHDGRDRKVWLDNGLGWVRKRLKRGKHSLD